MRLLLAAFAVPLSVHAQAIARVEVAPAETTMVVGSSITLRAVARDDKGAAA